MKIYTKTGDKGQTSLLNGVRVDKLDVRIRLLGQIDKLNAYVGMNIANFDEIDIAKENLLKQVKLLRQIQNLLFEVGTEIARSNSEAINSNIVDNISYTTTDMEIQIDDMSLSTSELKNFILPGGTKIASFAHLTRTIVREIEIFFIAHGDTFEIEEFNIFLNRLSDYFFSLARYLNLLGGLEDIVWKP
ncbi:cob(I)yrinic acid a,c-diamide adenosyltransferase [bacterium]|nr:MAG: cob(I)yrinic acid a,c-diamide adenosyltransferase [bacterium]